MKKGQFAKGLFGVLCAAALAGCATNNSQWQYYELRMQNAGAALRISKLNEMGKQGWEVVHFHRNESGSNQTTYLLKRKRQKAK